MNRKSKNTDNIKLELQLCHLANIILKKLKHFGNPSQNRTTGCCLPYGITQCYLPSNTSEHTLP